MHPGANPGANPAARDADLDRRQHRRLAVEIEVELHRDGLPICLAKTENLSNGGLLLAMDDCARPPIGSRLKVRVVGLLGGGETPPLVDAEVVRHVADGIGVRFLGTT